jgi:hypothetical protein
MIKAKKALAAVIKAKKAPVVETKTLAIAKASEFQPGIMPAEPSL